MTEADVIAHWRRGAIDALEGAQLLHDGGKYALALFETHLSVEKVFKAQYMEEQRREPPATHNLTLLARALRCPWTTDQLRQLDYLTQYAVAARYDDPPWAHREATRTNSQKWIDVADVFLTHLLP